MGIAVTEHTTRAFDADLLDLTRMISEMGGYAERQLIEAVDALSKCDSAHGERVVLADARLDAQQRDVEQKAIETIATRQPMAVDLREIVGILRIANELERIGDLALFRIARLHQHVRRGRSVHRERCRISSGLERSRDSSWRYGSDRADVAQAQ